MTRLASRALIRIRPQDPSEDATQFLQALVTSDVTGALPVWSGLLTPQGKALFDFLVWPGEDGLLIDCEADAAEALVRKLSIYRLRRKLEIAIDPGLGVHWRPHIGDGAAPDPRLSALGERWIAPVEAGSSDEEPVDAAWRAHRLRFGVTEGRAELGEGELLWLECNAAELNGVSFAKGCYIGQENTARMNWRQKVNRRLVVVPLDRSDPERRRIAYPELGLAIDHKRLEDIDTHAAPAWLAPALAG